MSKKTVLFLIVMAISTVACVKTVFFNDRILADQTGEPSERLTPLSVFDDGIGYYEKPSTALRAVSYYRLEDGNETKVSAPDTRGAKQTESFLSNVIPPQMRPLEPDGHKRLFWELIRENEPLRLFEVRLNDSFPKDAGYPTWLPGFDALRVFQPKNTNKYPISLYVGDKSSVSAISLPSKFRGKLLVTLRSDPTREERYLFTRPASNSTRPIDLTNESPHWVFKLDNKLNAIGTAPWPGVAPLYQIEEGRTCFSCGCGCYAGVSLFVRNGRIIAHSWGAPMQDDIRGLYELSGGSWHMIKAGYFDPRIAISPNGCLAAVTRLHRKGDTPELLDLCTNQ